MNVFVRVWVAVYHAGVVEIASKTENSNYLTQRSRWGNLALQNRYQNVLNHRLPPDLW